jgi:ribosomal RNA assembly protein
MANNGKNLINPKFNISALLFYGRVIMSIHEDRIGVLIGKKGSVKSLIEQICLVSIVIDSETGRYEITVPEDKKPQNNQKVTNDTETKGNNDLEQDNPKSDEISEEEEELDDDFFSDESEFYSEDSDLKFGYDNESIKKIEINLDSPEVKDFQKSDDAYRIFIARRVIDAINYGFHPSKALKIIHPNVHLDVFDLEDKIGTSTKKLTRYKGRLIGEQGKMRQNIEFYANVYMSIFNKYLALIGMPDKLIIAKKSISMILKGSPHKAVISYLQSEYQKEKQEEIKKNWKPIF